ncbi:FadR/GntR family transcriptional regulator [Amycolatopsis rhabdoformis]|uniref:FadR/GntR family transcriptional regulator n=1 Tax=Amycolatopsis rhabdoformis TaxID=1448059 RepID=A0ABZ1IBU6_9PSEU|nr:FadR/GntR family transcriptional regulator [Amycolatopsis rhabdoformis]WSE31951.1 FadR/GntR family transcriptional regulator [Amycolatopsis rhabdoformis]
MSLTDEAIARIRELIQSGKLPPGSKLPPEQQLATELGISRSPMREAVKALAVARVLDVRRGDGTYVTSLAPTVLLEGLGLAVELMHGNTLLELTEVRRLFEPIATGLAATRATREDLTEIHGHLAAMRAAAGDVELLNQHDAAFHRAVAAATGNEALATLLDGIAGGTLRARVWRGMVEAESADRTLAEHEAIYEALAEGDAGLAQAAALVHISTTERWLRRVHGAGPGDPR